MTNRRVPAFLILVLFSLAGCGGGGSGTVETGKSPNTYRGLGYTDVLYRGTLTAVNAAGETVSGPVGVTIAPRGSVSLDGSIATAYGLVAPDPDRAEAFTGYSFFIPASPSRSLLFMPFVGDRQFFGTSVIGSRSETLRVSFTDPTSGVKATLVAKADDPDLKPGKPLAGNYEGTNYGRGSRSGALSYVGPARGRIEADGSFVLKFVALGFSRTGELRGKVGADGIVSDPILIRDDNVSHLSAQTTTVYGDANDLTVIVRSPLIEQVGDTYRLSRTGD